MSDVQTRAAEPGNGNMSETATLRAIAECTTRLVGDDFLRQLVEHVAIAVNMKNAFVSEFLPPTRVRTVAYWSHGKIIGNIEFELPGTPCEAVIDGKSCHFPCDVQKLFPREKGIESYIGVPLIAQDGTVLGHLCAFDSVPKPDAQRQLPMFEIFAGRAAAELDRLRFEQKLAESEARLKDLFDEAPFAYVHEDLDSRFIRANQTAIQLLGITPDEVKGFVGMSLVADTPDNQKRLKEAFASIGKGVNTGGVVLELKRKDNGKPLWIEWWSRPDRSGEYTRTMFRDITDRVLLEKERAHLVAQNEYLREEIKAAYNFEEIIGSSAGLKRALDNVRRVAPTNASVLILGETGTGKELIARAIHSASKRQDKPFVKVNCAALPPSLIESELFGHERGAFSGALQKRVGRFELAHHGTIFLDEIGEMPLDVQVKLLRVLQDRLLNRLGSNENIETDVRVIAATNRDLPAAVAAGAFRADLYYRLNVFPIQLPALRERSGDIAELAGFFVQKYAPQLGARVSSICPDSMRRLTEYTWPGNIRELENVIQRALILEESTVLTIDPGALSVAKTVRNSEEPQPATDSSIAVPDGRPADLNRVQREHIITVLRESGWVVEGDRGAAIRLGMKPATLRHRMKKLSIERPKSAF